MWYLCKTKNKVLEPLCRPFSHPPYEPGFRRYLDIGSFTVFFLIHRLKSTWHQPKNIIRVHLEFEIPNQKEIRTNNSRQKCLYTIFEKASLLLALLLTIYYYGKAGTETPEQRTKEHLSVDSEPDGIPSLTALMMYSWWNKSHHKSVVLYDNWLDKSIWELYNHV